MLFVTVMSVAAVLLLMFMAPIMACIAMFVAWMAQLARHQLRRHSEALERDLAFVRASDDYDRENAVRLLSGRTSMSLLSALKR
ncbi:hypothetical protein [Salinisphaera sp. T31B1]|uniref:hypothetical protein n=1 Tax=Salinisphaera sp. T31B1 TaxID=727963 RepID=UPI0033420BCD